MVLVLLLVIDALIAWIIALQVVSINTFLTYLEILTHLGLTALKFPQQIKKFQITTQI